MRGKLCCGGELEQEGGSASERAVHEEEVATQIQFQCYGEGFS